MQSHDTNGHAAIPAPRTMVTIVLCFADVNDENYEVSSGNNPALPGNAPYQRAVQRLLEEELDCQSTLTWITVAYRDGEMAWREVINRLTLHTRAGEEAIQMQNGVA